MLTISQIGVDHFTCIISFSSNGTFAYDPSFIVEETDAQRGYMSQTHSQLCSERKSWDFKPALSNSLCFVDVVNLSFLLKDQNLDFSSELIIIKTNLTEHLTTLKVLSHLTLITSL